MTNIVRIKRRAAGSPAGAPSSLQNAELAYNEQDNILYYGFGTGGVGGSATQIIPIAGSGAYVPIAHVGSGDTAHALAIAGGAAGFMSGADKTKLDNAASQAYVDSAVQGLDPKQSVRAATIVAGTLATDFANNSVIDGVTLATNDRILIQNQVLPAQNGIYIVNASGLPSRASDMNSWAEVPGSYVFVEEGTANADIGFVCSSNAGGTLDTTAITWVQFSGAGQITANNGVVKTGNIVSVGTGVNGVDLTTQVKNTLPVANGGTGYSTYAIGDLLYASTTAALSKLADIAAGNVLLSGGVNVAPFYGKVTLTGHVNGTLPVANGGTGNTTGYAAGLAGGLIGSIPYQTAVNTTAMLAGGTTGQVLVANFENAPSWSSDYLNTSSTIDGGTF